MRFWKTGFNKCASGVVPYQSVQSAYSYVHPYLRSFLRLSVRPFVPYLVRPFVRPSIRSSVRQFVRLEHYLNLLLVVRSAVGRFRWPGFLTVLCRGVHNAFVHPCVRSFVSSFVRPFVRPFFCSSVCSFVRSFVRLQFPLAADSLFI